MRSYFLGICLVLFVYCDAQNVGIGSTAPIAKFEVKGDGVSSAGNTFVLKNSIGDTLLRMRNDGRMSIGFNGNSFGRPMNLGGIGMNFYRNDDVFSGAVFPTDTSLVIWSQIDDNNYVIIQPSWGKVGIGTYSPKAFLHVNGDFILGVGGSILNNIIKMSLTKNVASVVANATVTETFAVTGALDNATVFISPDLALPDGLIIAYARVSAINTVEVKFTNTTAATINPNSMSFHITVVN